MNAQHWDNLATDYESEVFDVLANDRNGLIADRIARSGAPGKSASDLGCGIGRFLPLLSQSFRRVFAVDHSARLLDRARESCDGLDNVTYLKHDLSAESSPLPPVDFALCVNSLLSPSLRRRRAMLDCLAGHLKTQGMLLLVVPALESALLAGAMLIEWNLRDGLAPASAVRSGFRAPTRADAWHLRQGVVDADGVPTKHYLKEELAAALQSRGLQILEISKLEYPWSTEFDSPPEWMQGPYPWDWLVLARKSSPAA